MQARRGWGWFAAANLPEAVRPTLRQNPSLRGYAFVGGPAAALGFDCGQLCAMGGVSVLAWVRRECVAGFWSLGRPFLLTECVFIGVSVWWWEMAL